MPSTLDVGVGILDQPIAQGVVTHLPNIVTDTGVLLVTDTGLEIIKRGT